MRVNRNLEQLLIKSLYESMSTREMVKLTRQIFPHYNIHERTGFPENMPVPPMHAAEQITEDVIKEEIFLQFVTLLIDVYQNGFMSKKIQIKVLPQILSELMSQGLFYNPEFRTFVENQSEKVSKGWRILEEGKSYEFSLLSIDIVNNTELVRQYPMEKISSTYTDIRELVKKHIEKRNGRIWGWEGDGGLAAFYFQNKNVMAVLSGIDILLDLFFYNVFKCRLNEPLQIRMAIHTGPCQFYHDMGNIKNETVQKLEILVSEHTPPDTLTISPSVYQDLGRKLEKYFKPIPKSKVYNLYQFTLRWES
jgi:class 3 adenylate cyclase